MKQLFLENENIKLEFLFGYCNLIYRSIVLTKNIGLYSSIYHKEKWYDSRFASWQILKATKTELELYGEWVNLPHRQIWLFSMEEDKLNWRIEGKNLSELSLEMMQQNFMLTDSYNHWEVKGYAQGRFPEFFSNYQGLLWDRIWSMPKMKDTEIVLSSDNTDIPELCWVPPVTEKHALVVIENTEPLYCARLVQSLFVNITKEPIKENHPLNLSMTMKING